MNYFQKILQQLLGPSLALILSFFVGGIFISIIGKDPVEIYTRFFSQSLGTWYGIGQILFKATPLIFTGLSVAIAFRSGLFNIGAEGQLTIGALFTAIIAANVANIPPVFALPMCLLSGFLGGAIWGALPGIFKAKFGSHEVINTIMMNFIAAGLASYLVINIFGIPATVHTQEISSTAELSRLENFSNVFRGSPVNLSLFIAILCCIFVYLLLWKTRLGYELRALGLSPTAAEYGGINKSARIIMAMTLAGGFAGLVGSNFVLGYKHYFELGFSDGIGFIGIAVALLAKNNPIGIIFTALFFGTLEYGSLTINTLVPKELSNILQAIVILLMIGLTKYIDHWFIRHQVKAPEIVNG
jgi:general nucleoside transport system permease protein